MATIKVKCTTATYLYVLIDYTVEDNLLTINGITGYTTSNSGRESANLTHTIKFLGVSVSFQTTRSGFLSSGFEWALTDSPKIYTNGIGKIELRYSSGSSYAIFRNRGFVSDDDLTVPKYNQVTSHLELLSPSIIGLKATCSSTVDYYGYEALYRKIEIGNNDVSKLLASVYYSTNSQGMVSGSVSISGQTINEAGLLGSPLKTIHQLFHINGGKTVNFYSSAYTPPANLMSNPVMSSGKPTVTKVTGSKISISRPSVTNWIRTESCFYCYSLVECDSSGNPQSTKYCKYADSYLIIQPIENLDLIIGSRQNSGTMIIDPTTETISTGTGYDYTLSRGSTYYFVTEAITKFIGVRRNSYSSLSDGVYIPYLPSLTKQRNFEYTWGNSYGDMWFRLVGAYVTINNPNNEYIGNKYIAIDSTKILCPGYDEQSGYWARGESNYSVKYTNSKISGTSHFWTYYATNKYSESVIEPLEVTDDWSQPAGLINCSLGELNVDVFGVFKCRNCVFNFPDNNNADLPLGTVSAKLDISKDSSFSTITHSQTKQVKNLGINENLFDDIQLSESDSGTNYVRLTWLLPDSSNYYNLPNVYSSVKTVEHIGMIPKIDSFTGYVDLQSGKIKCKVVETTGSPTPQLYLEVSRSLGGEVYETFEVVNDTEFELPYTEPGTTWYVRAKATNVLGTVYAVDSNNNIIEKTYQIPYTVTPDYETVANPTISAGKILYNNNCTLSFTWTNITTDVDHVKYNIRVESDNAPITPTDHNDKISGYNYTFSERKASEHVQYVLEVILYNSFDEVVLTYLINSNIITLDASDLGKQGFTFHTDTTYHSINYLLDTFDKNTTEEGNDNKLVQMSVELKDKETEERINYYFIGDETPTSSSSDLTPIQNYLFDDLLANHTYILIIDTLCVNPLDVNKQQRVTEQVEVSTNDLNIYPVNNLRVHVTNQVNNQPTANSDFQLKWDEPNKGDVDVIDYIVSYLITSSQTLVNVQEREYTLASETISLNNDDNVYLKVGARYLDWFNNNQVKWVELPVITVASTNYMYYDCNYPNTEKVKRKMYKMIDSQSIETLVKNVHIDK